MSTPIPATSPAGRKKTATDRRLTFLPFAAIIEGGKSSNFNIKGERAGARAEHIMMAKKIAVRLALIVITGAVLFALTYLISYRLTANKYNTEAMATTAAPAEETPAAEEAA